MHDDLDKPLRRKKPTVYAIWNDLFHPKVPTGFIDKVFAVMALCPQHTFVVLTKRPSEMGDYSEGVVALRPLGRTGTGQKIPRWYDAISDWLDEGAGGFFTSQQWDRAHDPTGEIPNLFPLPNVILGASPCDQPTLDEYAPHLRRLAGQGWRTIVSLEPLLGPVNILPWTAAGLECSACTWRGDETQSERRDFPDEPDGWACPECAEPCGHLPSNEELSGVIVGGETGPGARPMDLDWVRPIRDRCQVRGVPFFLKQVDAKRNRELDGRTWDELPE